MDTVVEVVDDRDGEGNAYTWITFSCILESFCLDSSRYENEADYLFANSYCKTKQT